MRGPREAIHTAVLAAAVGVDRLREGNVRRVVAGDDAARVFRGDAGARARRGFVQQHTLPAVVLGVVAEGFEAAFRIGSGAASLDRLRWKEGIAHPLSVARGHLTARDICQKIFRSNEISNPHHPTEQRRPRLLPHAFHTEATSIWSLVMFNNAWVGFPCSSLVECLIVFALLFFAGFLWSWGLRRYVAHRLKDDVHA